MNQIIKSVLFILTFIPTIVFSQNIQNGIAQLEQKKDSLTKELNKIETQISELDKKISEYNDAVVTPTDSNFLATTIMSFSGALRSSPNLTDNILKKLQKGDTINVISKEKDYYKVQASNITGYINDVFLQDSVFRTLNIRDITENDAKNKASYYKVNRKLEIGMNKSIVINIVGRPKDISKTTNVWGVSEQWIYERHNGIKYLYFTDGILTTIQE